MVTDLIRESMMTTRGQMIRRGETEAEAFAGGSQFQALYMYDDDPTWIDPYYYLEDTGDMPVMGSEAIDKIAAGAVGTVLKGKGALTKPAFELLYSLLTTWGDIIVRGETAALRLPVGALDYIFTSRGAGQTPNWQYLYKLLTTQGDLIVRGAAAAERLVAAANGLVLKSKGAGQKPAYEELYSLLTTEGDIIVRGAAAAERLAKPAAHNVLTSGDAAGKPYWYKPVLKHNMIHSAEFNIDATEVKNVSGVGFQPSLIIFLAVDGTPTNLNFSVGFSIDADPIKNRSMKIADDGADIGPSANGVILRRDVSNLIVGNVTAYGVDGFEFTVTETGTSIGAVTALCIG